MATTVARREFIALVGGAAVLASPLARAQQKMPVIGVLGSTTAKGWASRFDNFRQGLKEAGFVEGRNVAIEARWADYQYDRLPAMAAELVRARVSLIVAVGTNLPARAARNATTTIPIVFAMGADPVQLGLVASLARPGGNVTGVTLLAADQIQKRLQLLHDVVPHARTFGLLVNPDNFAGTSSTGRTPIEMAQDAVRSWGATIEAAQARSVGDFDAAVASLMKKRIEVLATSSDALFTSNQERLVAIAAQHGLPTAYSATEAAHAGGLVSYSASRSDFGRQAGLYAGRILKGAKPADLPVLLPTKFEMVINLKTARALKLTIARELLLAADEVIE